MTRVSIFRYPLFALTSWLFLWENLRSSFELHVNPHENEARQDKYLDHPDDDSSFNVPPQESRPHLIIHIGPPKSATTTLQEELYSNPRMLAQDGYLYTGAFYKDGRHHGDIQQVKDLISSVDCHRKLEKVRIHHDGEEETQHSNMTHRKSLADKLRQIECWKASLKALQEYKRQNTSLIYSDETRSIMRWKTWHNTSQPAPFDLLSLKQVLQTDWNVVIVVTYRRYWEWIMSAKQQIERYTRKKPRHRNWPSSPEEQQEEDGFDFQAPFPAILTIESGNSSYYPFYYTDTIRNAVRSHFPVKILNLHDKQSVRSSFLCSVLDNAPHACRDSLKQDEKQQETRANVQKSESVFYNVLATAAVRKGLVNSTLYKRRRAVLEATRLHQDVLGKSPLDFAMQCPSEPELSALLQLSLKKEKEIMPEFYASHQAEHRADFWKAAEKKTFCWIDTDTVLEESVWRRFFSQYK